MSNTSLRANVVVLGLVSCLVGFAVSASARDTRTALGVSGSLSAPYDSAWMSNPDWPLWYATQQTGKVNASFTSWGTFGPGLNPTYSWGALLQYPGFESPPDSNMAYLFGGAIWVGGIVGADTLVSTGSDGWGGFSNEMYPPAGPDGRMAGSITSFLYASSLSLRAEFSDTLATGPTRYAQDFLDHRSHKPMNLRIANRSHVRREPPYDDCIIYDLVITNMGDQTIHQGYVGFYFDCDIGNSSGYSWDIAGDDMTGSLAADSIAYCIDDDGDANGTAPVPRAFAFKVLRTSFPLQSASYNWWLSSGFASLDWGPQKKTNFRDRGTGSKGTPLGDRHEYAYMSNGEWDFDQVRTAEVLATDTTWMPLDSQVAASLSRGMDTRFLYAVGPFELEPDSSIRILYTTFTGSRVHTDPDNFRDNVAMSYNPEKYLSKLDFSGVRLASHAAALYADTLLDPTLPAVGLKALLTLPDTVTLQWDPWVYPGVESHYIYLDAIPRSAYLHEGVPPMWYQRLEVPWEQIGQETHHVLMGLSPYSAYICNVAYGTATTGGDASRAIIIKLPTPLNPPQVVDTSVYVRSTDSLVIRWHPATGAPVDHYNVYMFPDTVAAKHKFQKHYSEYRGPAPVDSVHADSTWYYYYAMPVYAAVSPGETTFVDAAPGDGTVFIVTAVDTAGFESDFSANIAAYRLPPADKDILLMTNSQFYLTNYAYTDSILHFYDRILSGYSHDYYDVEDSLAECTPLRPGCIDWRDMTRYKVVIVDDGLRDMILRDWYEDAQHGFSEYLLAGGHLVYFGSFSQCGSPALSVSTSAGWYSRTKSFIDRFFGVDSVFFAGVNYYKNVATSPYIDSVLGFAYAEPVAAEPLVTFNSARNPFTPDVASAWPSTSPPSVSAFVADSTATVTHLFRSLTPATSRVDGHPVGLHKQTTESDAYLFGFHLWYMQESEAKQLIDWILQRIPTDVDDTPVRALPRSVRLAQNYPNPFNPSTTIQYELAEAGWVRLEVFNILGQKVRSLLDEAEPAGAYTLQWNGTDQQGNPVATGVYLYRLTAGGRQLVRKMLLLK